MNEYHKINSIFKRDQTGKQLLEGQYSTPEFEYLKDNVWEFSEKIDGMNCRVMYDVGRIFFGGKTDNAQMPIKLLAHLLSIFNDVDKFRSIANSYEICFYGEAIGAGIQKGGKYSLNQIFVLFDVKIGYWWLKREDIEDIAIQFDIPVVPIIGEGTLYDMVDLAKNGFKSRWGDFIAEGIVARPKIELKARSGERIITKIKYKDFRHE